MSVVFAGVIVVIISSASDDVTAQLQLSFVGLTVSFSKCSHSNCMSINGIHIYVISCLCVFLQFYDRRCFSAFAGVDVLWHCVL